MDEATSGRRDGSTAAIFPLDPSRLRLAADLLVRHPFRCWFYGDSIGFEGLIAASDVLADATYESFAHGFVRAWACRAEPYQQDDNTAPGNVMCALYERTGDDGILDAALRLADVLRTRRRVAGVSLTHESAPLLRPYGGGSLAPDEVALLRRPGPVLYLDCLHFDPPFFAHLWRITGEDSYLQAAVEEALGYVELLQDSKTGLFHHFWLERTERAYILGWGRGQGWALLGLLDVLAVVPRDHPSWERLRIATMRLAVSMREAQLPDGSWQTVVGQSGSVLERSTSAFMAAAFARAIRLGIVESDWNESADRAWEATCAAVDEHGTLTGVSSAVYSSTAVDHYVNVPTGLIVPWGQGPLLVAALERGRLRAGGS